MSTYRYLVWEPSHDLDLCPPSSCTSVTLGGTSSLQSRLRPPRSSVDPLLTPLLVRSVFLVVLPSGSQWPSLSLFSHESLDFVCPHTVAKSWILLSSSSAPGWVTRIRNPSNKLVVTRWTRTVVDRTRNIVFLLPQSSRSEIRVLSSESQQKVRRSYKVITFRYGAPTSH